MHPNAKHQGAPVHKVFTILTHVPDTCQAPIYMEQMGHIDITTTKKFYYNSNKNQKTKEKQIEKAINI